MEQGSQSDIDDPVSHDKSTLYNVLHSTGPWLNLDRVIFISFGFMIQFTGYSAVLNITPKILKDLGYNNLGFINLSTINIVFAISSLFAAPIIKKFGALKVLFFSSLSYPIWIFTFLAPAWKYDNRDKTKTFGFF